VIEARTSPNSISKIAPPIPAGWSVALIPSALTLAPGEEHEVKAEITPPAGFKGVTPFNVTARDDIGLVGVTLLVEAV
jgi:hypothetical protein